MTKTKPRFSVVIPCFNQGAFLGEALESVFTQTEPAFEIWVVDDGSDDPHSKQVIDRLCQGPVQLVRQEHSGVSCARNAGIARSTGDVILPLDADDHLTPDALAVFADAMRNDPTIDIWCPDVVHFGLDTSTWRCPPFNAWRQSQANHLVYCCAFRRAIFDGGVLYDPDLLDGGEDWDVSIQAICERSFRAAPVAKTLLRKRCWGHPAEVEPSLRPAVIDHIHRRRSALFDSPGRLDALKRHWSPAVAIAARGKKLGAAVARQTFQDVRIVDEDDSVTRESDLSAFAAMPSRWLLVSIDDEGLRLAFDADPMILEKTVHMLVNHEPGVVALTSWGEASRAYPGQLLPEELPVHDLECIGFVVAMEAVLMPGAQRRRGALLDDLWQNMWGWKGGCRVWVLGCVAAAGVPVPRYRPPATAVGTTNGVPPATPGIALSRLLALKHAAYHLAESVLGARGRQRLVEWAQAVRKSPIAVESVKVSIPTERATVEEPANGFPALPCEPVRMPSASVESGRSLMVVVSWMVMGGAERVVLDMIEALVKIDPQLRIYLMTIVPIAAHPGPQYWADRLRPQIAGSFSLPDLARDQLVPALVAWCERLAVDTVLVSETFEGFWAAQQLHALGKPPRVVGVLHTFEIDPRTLSRRGFADLIPSQYDRYLDAYLLTAPTLKKELVKSYYVSPSKLEVISAVIDVRHFEAARRVRFAPGSIPSILWLARLHPQKNPITALEFARLWRARHPKIPIQLVIAGGGPLEAEVRNYHRVHELEPWVSLVGEIEDPAILFKQADCLMLTSLYEGIPLVIYEAMAADLPIVTPIENTSIPDALRAEEAYFIENAINAAEYVSVFERILAQPEDARVKSARCHARRAALDPSRFGKSVHKLLFPGP